MSLNSEKMKEVVRAKMGRVRAELDKPHDDERSAKLSHLYILLANFLEAISPGEGAKRNCSRQR